MDILPNGIHVISNEEYHAQPAISRSALMSFKRSPQHYWHDYLNPEKEIKEPTAAMILGNLVHIMVLEPQKFNEEFIVLPEFNKRTKDGKQRYSDFCAANREKTFVTLEQSHLALNIAEKISEHRLSYALIADAKIENSIFFTHASGIQCKVRPDSWKGSLIVDLKTTDNTEYRAFQSSALKYGYFLQAGMIAQALKTVGHKLDKFVFLAVEKTAPHVVGLFVLDPEAIQYGINQFNNLMIKFADCQENNHWHSYDIQSLSVPSYAE